MKRKVAGPGVALALLTLAACSSGRLHGQPPSAGSTPASLGISTTEVLPAPATSTSAPRCTNMSVIEAWPVARKAAELVVVPVLDGDPAAVAVAKGQGAGGILLLGQVPAAASLRSTLAPLHGNTMVMSDEEGGGVQRLLPDVGSVPWPRTMASDMSPAQVRTAARVLGTQMLALGVDVDLAPVLDVDGGPSLSDRDPDGPRSFSPDPATAATYGLAFEQGLRDVGVLPVVKHFPGLGGSTGNTDFSPASTQSISSLRASGLVPFERAITAGAPAIMMANASVPGLTSSPASLSAASVNGLLRGQLGYGGLVMTDSLSAGAISAAGYTVPTAAVAAVEAGVDMVLFGSTLTAADTAGLAPRSLATTTEAIVSALAAAAKSGALPMPRLNAAVDHIVTAEGTPLCR